VKASPYPPPKEGKKASIKQFSNLQIALMNEHFYTSIAQYYPHIFPFNPA